MKRRDHAADAHMLIEQETIWYLRQFAPTWTLHVTGPIPLGQTEPIHYIFEYICQPTEDLAVDAVAAMLMVVCDKSGIEWDPQQWEVNEIIHANWN